jgi:glyoxylase-like metal-dependent hydrolase (beta-lactamase superfamily II)
MAPLSPLFALFNRRHRPKTRVLSVLVALVLLPLPTGAQAGRAPTKTEVAPGVFVFSTPPYGDVGLDGNSIVILSNDGVLVFDSNGTPAASAAVLAEIRGMTERPVRYVVNSHWHWDHWYGTETYTAAFPNVQVVAHEKTRQMMIGPALVFNQPGLERQLPAYIQSLEKKLATADDARLRAVLEEDRFFLEQKKNVHHTFPTVTFSNRLAIELGERHIEVLHYERAVTPGDTFLYLPKEKLLIAGDLLVNPVTFALSSYPTEWLRTLERIDALDVTTIVTGHGAPLRDKQLLHATMDVFRVLLKEGRAAKARGLDPDQAKAEILPGLHDLMVTITGDDPRVNGAFHTQLVDWYLHRVYDELNGPLSDDIAAIPAS